MTRRSQRARLLARPRPAAPYPVLVDPDRAERAKARLATAQAAMRQVVLRGDRATKEEHDQAAAEQAAAEKDLGGCYETVMLQALKPADVEDLIAAHPPTADQLAKAKQEREQARQRGDQPPDWPAWNDASFRPALLEASADSDMTAADWADLLSNSMSVGEVRALWAACLRVNLADRMADPVVLPKGSTTTRS